MPPTHRARRALKRRTARPGPPAAPILPHPDPGRPYPDYVTCPYCGEPEVEVWCHEPTARCHNCGRTFDHPIPPDCKSG